MQVKRKNNEEYKQVIKSKMRAMVVIFLIGAVTLIVSLLAEAMWKVDISAHMLGAYSGVGTGYGISYNLCCDI